MDEATILRQIREQTGTDLMDDGDEIYDAMVAAGERAEQWRDDPVEHARHDAEYRRLSRLNDLVLAELKARGLLS